MTDIRPARPSDLDDVVSLEAQVFGDHAWSPRAVEAEFAALGQSRVIDVAIDRGRLVAYAVLLTAGDTGDLTRVVVAATHRRLGLATRLIDRLATQAAAAGLDQVLLEVAAGNAEATGCYRKAGFAEIDRRAGYYPDGQDAVVMRRGLGDAPAGGARG